MFTASFNPVFYVSEYRNFWNNESWKSYVKYFSILLFHM